MQVELLPDRAGQRLFEYLEIWPNRPRPHSARGRLSPLRFEHHTTIAVAWTPETQLHPTRATPESPGTPGRSSLSLADSASPRKPLLRRDIVPPMLSNMNDAFTWLDDDQQDLWQDLLTIIIAMPTVLDRQLQRDAAISNFEYSVLARLSMVSGATMRLSDLAEVCNCTQPRLSKVMDRFETRDWVARRTDPQDGRYTLATLTDAGTQKVVTSAPEHVAQVKRVVFDPLSIAQRRHLGAALSRIAASVRREFEGG